MGFLTFNEKTGLLVKTKSQIQQELIELAKQAYGNTLVVSEGSELYTFIDVLSAALTETGNAAKAVYDAFGFITASGTPLDVLCSTAGISRRTLADGTLESDNALRARYYRFLYTPSSSTVQGLIAKLLAYTTTYKNTLYYAVVEAKVINNDSTSPMQTSAYPNLDIDVPAHSIYVSVKLNDDMVTAMASDPNTLSKVKQELSDIVLNYKSLGCGVAQIIANDQPSTLALTIAEALPLTITITLNTTIAQETSPNAWYAVQQAIIANVTNYINGLKLGEDILSSGIRSCVYKAYVQLGYEDYVFEVDTIQISGASSAEDGYWVTKVNKFATVSSITVSIA